MRLGGLKSRVFLAAVAAIAGATLWLVPFGLAREPTSDLYGEPEAVRIEGYAGTAMEPFLSPDGRFLFFNDSNAPGADMSLHFAERTGPLAFRYLGRLPGTDSSTLDGVASLDTAGRLYFTTLRSYAATRESIFVGDFDGSRVAGAQAVRGDISPHWPGAVNMDASVSPDGRTLYLSRAAFLPPMKVPFQSDILVARSENGAFTLDPEGESLMRNVNTRALEYAPAISPDGRELYFTRASVPGGLRLMVATRAAADVPFGEPRALRALSGFVEAPTLSQDLRELFYHKKVGEGFVIYRARRI